MRLHFPDYVSKSAPLMSQMRLDPDYVYDLLQRDARNDTKTIEAVESDHPDRIEIYRLGMRTHLHVRVGWISRVSANNLVKHGLTVAPF